MANEEDSTKPEATYYKYGPFEFELQTGQFLRQCSWCGKTSTSQGWTEVDDDKLPPDIQISHTICEPCNKRYLKELGEMQTARE